MKTPYLGEEIERLESFKNPITEHIEQLKEFKAIKKALSIHSVSYPVAQQYAEFCVRCDREKLPLIKIDDYLKQL